MGEAALVTTDGARVRPCAIADLDAVAALEREIFGEGGYPPFFFRQALDLFGDCFVVAVVEGGCAGYALGGWAAGSDRAWLLSAGVAPLHRGKGIAQELTRAVLARLRERGAPEVWLTVAPDNAAAVAAYERTGFERAGFEPDYYGTGESRLLMQRTM